jgi:hypothetical protein
LITATIILGSIAFALVYSCVWFCIPRLRRQIEQPKYWFLDQVQQYDRQCAGPDTSTTETSTTETSTAGTSTVDTTLADKSTADMRQTDARTDGQHAD